MSGYAGIKVPSRTKSVGRRNVAPPVSNPRSVFSLSSGVKTSFIGGYVVPVKVWQVLPGDTFTVKLTALARLYTLIRPIMDNLFCDVHFVYVPWRIIWDHTEEFFGQQANPGDSTSFILPQFVASDHFTKTGVHDYMGVNPTFVGGGSNVRTFGSMPWRGYRKIWNDLYRDENLQNSEFCPTGDGPDDITNGGINEGDGMLRRGKRGDRFTTSLPWPQKGTAVQLPAGGTTGYAPVVSAGIGNLGRPTFKDNAGTATKFGGLAAYSSSVTPQLGLTSPSGASWVAGDVAVWDNPGLRVNFQTAMGTVNEFRQAYAMQVYLERNARGGTRYVEYLKSQWGVTSSDARLQRPEYLGGGSFPVNISAIAQQSATAGASPQGNLAGVAVATAHGIGFAQSFEEHGYVYCLVSVRADMSYMSGQHPMFAQRTVFDVPSPVFANVGEEPVYNREIFYNNDANDALVFGYQERYSAFKQDWSTCTSYMRSNAGVNTLDTWHVAQKYTVVPVLNENFIVEPYTNVDRVIAVPAGYADQWSWDSNFDVRVARCLPVYGVPGLAGRS